MIPLQIFLPADLNSKESSEEEDSNEENVDKPVTYSMFFYNFRSLITLLATMIVMLMIDFLDSILSVELENNFGITGDTVGYIFAIPFFIYVLGVPVVTYIGDRLNRRITISFAFLICTISCLLTGPSQALNIPE